jgi:general secretion pathway protein G
MSFTNIKKQGGFTLLELLIVIVIIGILALLILPNITSAPKKARDTKRKTDLTAIQKGLEEYFVNNNIYPASLTSLTVGSAPIMKTVPTDPTNSGNYTYVYAPTPSGGPYTGYSLDACLENNSDSGTDVITAVSPCTTKTFQLVADN